MNAIISKQVQSPQRVQSDSPPLRTNFTNIINRWLTNTNVNNQAVANELQTLLDNNLNLLNAADRGALRDIIQRVRNGNRNFFSDLFSGLRSQQLNNDNANPSVIINSQTRPVPREVQDLNAFINNNGMSGRQIDKIALNLHQRIYTLIFVNNVISSIDKVLGGTDLTEQQKTRLNSQKAQMVIIQTAMQTVLGGNPTADFTPHQARIWEALRVIHGIIFPSWG